MLEFYAVAGARDARSGFSRTRGSVVRTIAGAVDLV
jgi:hypothetical protein